MPAKTAWAVLSQKLKVGMVLRDKYKIQAILGSGAYGAVLLVQDVESDITLAVKAESQTKEDNPLLGQLDIEYELMCRIQMARRLYRNEQRAQEREHVSPLPTDKDLVFEKHNIRHHLTGPMLPSDEEGEGGESGEGGSDGTFLDDAGHKLIIMVSYAGAHGERRRYIGFPSAMDYWLNTDLAIKFLVMQKLGQSLRALFSKHGCFSTKTTMQLAFQLTMRLEDMHDCGYIHRDIKPENVMMGPQDGDEEAQAQLYLIDFGICKKWIDNRGHHLARREKQHGIGTKKWMSVRGANMEEQSRIDDLETATYMLIFLHQGQLPWFNPSGSQVAHNIAPRPKEWKLMQDRHKLDETNWKKMCLMRPTMVWKGTTLPAFLKTWLSLCRKTKFTDRPPYREMRAAIRQEARAQGIVLNTRFDWSEKV